MIGLLLLNVHLVLLPTALPIALLLIVRCGMDICALACLLTYLLTYLACWLTYLLTYLLACLLAYLLARSLACLLAYLLVRSTLLPPEGPSGAPMVRWPGDPK